MEQQQQDVPEPPMVNREPLNRLSQEPPQLAAKEQSGCEQQDSSSRSSPQKTKPKPPRPHSSGSKSKPPRHQSSSKSTEYESNLESFHMIMLENIEKETNLIRRQGSFQLHQNHLSNQKNGRKQLQESENSPYGTPKRKGRDHHQRSSDPQMMVETANNTNVSSLLKETMNDISVAAASMTESLKHVIQQHTQQDQKSGKTNVVVGGAVVPLPVNLACGKIDDTATAFGMEEEDSSVVVGGAGAKSATSEFLLSSSSKTRAADASNDIMKKMHDGLKKLVVDATKGDRGADDESRNDQQQRVHDNNDTSNDWGVGNLLANGLGWQGEEEEDEIASKATYDTWDEENSVLRRLGSWGTVNSQFTAGTAGTGATFGTMATCETEGPSVIGPVSQALAKSKQQQDGEDMAPPGSHHLRDNGSGAAVHDDDGSLIDPALVEAALSKKKKKKRKGRRKKVVKFDYPPIKSLRQYTRPDPEDLPNLFFTEQELDQIEDDRYSTMSTDDIEIVAVASKETSPRNNNKNDDDDDALDARAKKKKDDGQDYEPGFKPVKGRSGTPNRRRSGQGAAAKNTKSPSTTEREEAAGEDDGDRSSPRRLVKGVQIYLRERSTGA